MKYIILLTWFFFLACKKNVQERVTEPREDSVAVLKDLDGWYIKITARYPTDFHRMIRVTILFQEEVWFMVKLPAGKTGLTLRIDPAMGDPVSWEAHEWGSWPFPD